MNIIDPKFDKRWEEGMDHHPKSIVLMEHIKEVDFHQGGDSFCWKTGGDGDNGETLMYEMDSFFEGQDEENKAFYVVNGEECFEVDNAMKTLLENGIIFFNCKDVKILDSSPPIYELVTYVLCNDTFAWGCADGELLPYAEIANLYRMYMADNAWGSIKWCCLQRNQKPQKPVVELMKKNGSWDEIMEALPDNGYDIAIKNLMKEKSQEGSMDEKKT